MQSTTYLRRNQKLTPEDYTVSKGTGDAAPLILSKGYPGLEEVQRVKQRSTPRGIYFAIVSATAMQTPILMQNPFW